MNGVDHNVKICIKAVWVLEKGLNTVENRNLVKRNLKTSCHIFNLTSCTLGMLTMNNIVRECAFEVMSTIMCFKIVEGNPIYGQPS